MQRRKRESYLSLFEMLEELGDELISESLGNLVGAKLLLANSTGKKGQCISQTSSHSYGFRTLRVPQLLEINEEVATVRIQDPVSHYLLHRYLQMLLEESDQSQSLRVKGLIGKHYLNESEAVLLSFSHFKLPLPKATLHKSLLVVYFEGLAVLFLGEMEEPNY